MGTSRKRRKQVLSVLHCATGALFDSNGKDKQWETETLERILRYTIELLRMGKLNDTRRKALARILQESAIAGDESVAITGNTIWFQGHLDIDELAKRIVWGGPLSESNIIEGG